MKKLVAEKSMRYAGRSLKAGDPFEAKDRDAKLLKAIKRASDAPRPKGGRPKKDEAPVEPVKTELPAVSPTSGADAGGTYSTRVMTAGE